MSFFPASERKSNWQKQGTPAPSTYRPSNNHAQAFACVPFGSTTKLNRSMTVHKEHNPETISNNITDQTYSLIAGLKQEQPSSAFKSGTTRFQPTYDQRPGPGDYNLDKSTLETRVRPSGTHSQMIKTKKTVPSIPVDNLGFKEDQNNQMTKVALAHLQTSEETFNPQSSLAGKGVVAWKGQKEMRRQPERYPGPGDYNYNLKNSKSVSSCFASTSDRFAKHRNLKQQKSPGPGSYNSFMQRPHQTNSQSFFNSKTARFQSNYNSSQVGLGSYFNDQKKSHSVNHIKRVVGGDEGLANKPVQRHTLFDLKNTNPGPGQYKTNYGISHQLQKMLIKKQTTDVMPKAKRQVFENKEAEETPGPATYETPVKTKKATGKLYKKTEVVNLKEEPEPQPSCVDYANTINTIEQKVKQMNSKLVLSQEKPFNSGTERFKHYAKPKPHEDSLDTLEPDSNIDVPSSDNKKVKRLVMTTIKVRVPFGTSANKYNETLPAYEGPDYYGRPQQWIKPSFNIKGKLQ